MQSCIMYIYGYKISPSFCRHFSPPRHSRCLGGVGWLIREITERGDIRKERNKWRAFRGRDYVGIWRDNSLKVDGVRIIGKMILEKGIKYREE